MVLILCPEVEKESRLFLFFKIMKKVLSGIP
jgi:hypothetical protein